MLQQPSIRIFVQELYLLQINMITGRIYYFWPSGQVKQNAKSYTNQKVF